MTMLRRYYGCWTNGKDVGLMDGDKAQPSTSSDRRT